MKDKINSMLRHFSRKNANLRENKKRSSKTQMYDDFIEENELIMTGLRLLLEKGKGA